MTQVMDESYYLDDHHPQSLSNQRKRYAQSTMWLQINITLAFGIFFNPLTTISTTFEKFLKKLLIK